MASSSWSYVDWGCCTRDVRKCPQCLSIITEGLQLTDELISTPFFGEGVNCAMHDSQQLAQQIVKYGLDDLDRAVSQYENRMFPRAIDIIEKSAESGKLLFAPDAPQGWLQAFIDSDSS